MIKFLQRSTQSGTESALRHTPFNIDVLGMASCSKRENLLLQTPCEAYGTPHAKLLASVS